MHGKALPERRRTQNFIVAPAGTSTWAVAFARHLIPGALFSTRTAAFDYACTLASAAGVGRRHIKVLA